MTHLRRVVLSLVFAAPMLIASQPASATGSCWTITKWGVGVTEAMAATEVRWLVDAKRSAWKMVKGPNSHVSAGPMTCGRMLLVYTCKVPVQVCK